MGGRLTILKGAMRYYAFVRDCGGSVEEFRENVYNPEEDCVYWSLDEDVINSSFFCELDRYDPLADIEFPCGRCLIRREGGGRTCMSEDNVVYKLLCTMANDEERKEHATTIMNIIRAELVKEVKEMHAK